MCKPKPKLACLWILGLWFFIGYWIKTELYFYTALPFLVFVGMSKCWGDGLDYMIKVATWINDTTASGNNPPTGSTYFAVYKSKKSPGKVKR